ncbi:hypothetical protein GCM10009715_36390 [Paeniglutamicibacter psychrophenolicus]|uniref:WYL domain-containing protein n=1 Tax=Paeniglutamicibacter psychrophenolicus TaxID=257454 RepID=A0ABS4WAM9_9MICC|nr:hypothetical protein [Paeniglutamicibacter psychrophenolicus]MBP2373225.1 hypothetical protein [Paeniglutamicibacter psychrophenolicus]
MAVIPDSTKTSLEQRLLIRARERWPQIRDIELRFRGRFAYVDARTAGDAEPTMQKLCRLRYGGSAHVWGFAIYRASHDDYDDSVLPSGLPLGSAEEALDTACGLYFNDPTAWT